MIQSIVDLDHKALEPETSDWMEVTFSGSRGNANRAQLNALGVSLLSLQKERELFRSIGSNAAIAVVYPNAPGCLSRLFVRLSVNTAFYQSAYPADFWYSICVETDRLGHSYATFAGYGLLAHGLHTLATRDPAAGIPSWTQDFVDSVKWVIETDLGATTLI